MCLAFPLGRKQIHGSACLNGLAWLDSVVGAVAPSGRESVSATRRHRDPDATDSYQFDRTGMVPALLTNIDLTDGNSRSQTAWNLLRWNEAFIDIQSKCARLYEWRMC